MARRAPCGCNSSPISPGSAIWPMTTACPSGTSRQGSPCALTDRRPPSRKGEALSGIVANTSAGLYAYLARASLGPDDEARDKRLANVPAQATAALIVRLGALCRNYAKLRNIGQRGGDGPGCEGECLWLAPSNAFTRFQKRDARPSSSPRLPRPKRFVLYPLMQRSMCWTVCSRGIARFTMSFASALFWEAWKRRLSGQPIAGAGGEAAGRDPYRYRHGAPWLKGA